ncbi:MAG TPA: TadE/TadG family type IV pilus assembly protein [Xanthobacteraceae bacterium]|nr:TadE/TadG family type IV pilus assembly protein [Xanthobacteraceae bacterium]
MVPTIATRLATGARRLPARAAARMLLLREDGQAMIEFAAVAAPFLALLFAIMETALMFFASQTLESAAQNSSRLILTGQAQNQGYTMASFQTAVCQSLNSMFNCNNVLIDVETAANFSSANTSLPIQNGQIQNNFSFSAGAAGDIVVVRLMYQWPVYVSLLGLSGSLSNMSGSSNLLMATAAFRNEPYQANP